MRPGHHRLSCVIRPGRRRRTRLHRHRLDRLRVWKSGGVRVRRWRVVLPGMEFRGRGMSCASPETRFEVQYREPSLRLRQLLRHRCHAGAQHDLPERNLGVRRRGMQLPGGRLSAGWPVLQLALAGFLTRNRTTLSASAVPDRAAPSGPSSPSNGPRAAKRRRASRARA